MKQKKESVSNEIAVRLTNVSKRYTIHHEKPTLVEHLTKGKHEEFWALKETNLTIRKGERIGIVGPNGSGKTTLLKIIAGITTPTMGDVETNGKIVSLIDLEAGFHPDLTGLENINMNAMLLGLSKNEIKEKLKVIIDFADIGQFIDVPLYTYSQGMKLRLGLSIALNANPDILVLDENIAVGDTHYQRKSEKKIKELSSGGTTLILVSQWIKLLNRYTRKRMCLSEGRLVSQI